MNSTKKILALSTLTIRELIHRKVHLPLGLIALLNLLTYWSWFDEHVEQDPSEMLQMFFERTFDFSVSVAGYASLAAGIILAATLIATDFRMRRLNCLLAKPIERWHYAMGRWMGLVLFLVFTVHLPIVLPGILIAQFSAVQWFSLYSLGLANLLASTILITGMTLGLALFLPPAKAGGLAAVIYNADVFLQLFAKVGGTWTEAIADAARHLCVAEPTVALIVRSSLPLTTYEWALNMAIVLDRAAYGLAFFLVGLLVFYRRDAILS